MQEPARRRLGRVALIGGDNPVTDVIGGGIIALGAGATTVGTVAQVGAGLYYLYQGNSAPLQDTAIARILGLAKTPALLGPTLDKASSAAIAQARKDNAQCAPASRP